MSGGQKKVMYKVRWCIRCGEYYRTAHKFSRCCTNCYKQPVNKQSSVSYFNRWVHKHGLEVEKN